MKKYTTPLRLSVIIVIILAVLIVCMLIFLKGESYKEMNILLNGSNAKLKGRTYEKDGVLWFSMSGSGVEFKINSPKCKLVLKGDSMAGDKIHLPRYGVYLDGKQVRDSVMKKKTETIKVYESDDRKEHVVKLVKLSESLDSSMGLASVKCDEESTIKPTLEKDLKIEFIGDSLVCGYGIEGKYGDIYSTSTENCNRAFAVKVAKALDADYSLFAISGYGVVSGFSEDGHKADDLTIPKYYTKLGYSEGRLPSGINPADVEWDFSYKPNYVVINLGTNDVAYVQGDPKRKEEFKKCYIKLLKLVREKNPNVPILCTLGIMSQDLCPEVEDAVAKYKKETGDSKVNYLTLDQNKGKLVIDEHPNEASYDRAARQIVEYIRSQIDIH